MTEKIVHWICIPQNPGGNTECTVPTVFIKLFIDCNHNSIEVYYVQSLTGSNIYNGLSTAMDFTSGRVCFVFGSL